MLLTNIIDTFVNTKKKHRIRTTSWSRSPSSLWCSTCASSLKLVRVLVSMNLKETAQRKRNPNSCNNASNVFSSLSWFSRLFLQGMRQAASCHMVFLCVVLIESSPQSLHRVPRFAPFCPKLCEDRNHSSPQSWLKPSQKSTVFMRKII